MDISLLGCGLLGTAIGERLLARGFRLHVWNRRPEHTQTLVAAGAQLASSPAEAVAAGDLVITVLSDGPITAEVLLNQAGTALPGRLVLQVATIAPAESIDLASALQQHGARYLETPVLGSRPEALAGTLQLMAGGPADLFAQALPLLRDLAAEPLHLGPVGSGMATKLALNQLIASLTHAFSLSLHLVQQGGVAVEPFMALLRSSALYASTFDKKLQRELSGDYANPNFPTAHLRKDLQLFVDAAAALQLETLGLRGLTELLQRARPAGLDTLDYSSLHRLTATGSSQQPGG